MPLCKSRSDAQDADPSARGDRKTASCLYK